MLTSDRPKYESTQVHPIKIHMFMRSRDCLSEYRDLKAAASLTVLTQHR